MTEEPIVLESNQNHATVTQNGVCPTLPASMGMGGGYVPMIVQKKIYGFLQFGVYKEDAESSQTVLAHTGGRDANMDLVVEIRHDKKPQERGDKTSSRI